MSDERRTAEEFPPEVLGLFDQYVHGFIDRRAFLDRAAKFAVAGMTAAGFLDALSPRYAWARQVDPDDPRIQARYVEYESPDGHGTMRGYMASPADGAPKGAVLVIHENRGLNPYIEDVVRRFGAADFLSFGPDALTPLGGYPGNDDEGRAMQRELDREKITEDFVAAVDFLLEHEESTGKVGAVGFCFGGGMVNTLAVRFGPRLAAGSPFYGRAAAAEDVPRIEAPLLIHYGGLDERVNAGWPDFKEALDANGKTYTMHMYEGANHGFHNDTTPRYDEEAAKIAQDRTIAFFNEYLR
jgi:carboxymethylenebutenolidase